MQWEAAIPGYLAGVVVRTLALAAVAGMSLLLLRVKSAAARHAVWTLVTLGMLLLAVLEPVLPSVPLRVLRAQPAGFGAVTEEQPEEAATAVPAMPSPRPAERPRRSPASVRKPISWQAGVTFVYLGGVLLFLVRLAVSYRFTRRLAAASRQVDEEVYESTWIAVPVTLGFRRPRILLPAGWRQWPADKLAAVMAHERTHVRRADWAIAVMADANRCLLWFHPLAWWLERHLAALAEQAADDAALLELEARESYAQTLLEMAAAVKAGRGRMVWEAMAMAKTAEVRMRIERILDETRQIPSGVTRGRWALLAAVSIPLVYLAAAVQLAPAQQTAIPPAPAEPAAIGAPPMRAVAPTPGVVFRAAVAAPAVAPLAAPPAPRQAEPSRPVFQVTVAASGEYPYPYLNPFSGVAASVQQKVDPVYPEQAMAAGIEGDVTVTAVVGADGRVKRALWITGDARLGPAAQAAVEQWIYNPATGANGEPVESNVTVRVPFRLHPEDAVHEWKPTNPSKDRPPVLLYKKEPDYVMQERAAGIQGTVVLSLTVDAGGKATDIQVVNSLSPLLDQSAIDAVGVWKFSPAIKEGAAVAQAVTIGVNFRLSAASAAAQVVAGPANNPAVDSKPVILYKMEPVYPQEARQAGRQGTVMLSALVSADGRVHNMKVTHSLGLEVH